MIIVIIITNILISFTLWILSKRLFTYKDIVQYHYENIDKDIQNIKMRLKEMESQIAVLMIDCVGIKFDVQMMRPILKNILDEEQKEPNIKERPANRKPRTNEQKKKASEQRKKWWEQKRKEREENGSLSPQSGTTLQQPDSNVEELLNALNR